MSLCRSCNAPHLVERVHVERQIVKFALVICDRAVRVAIEFNDGIHEIPYLLIARMENMRSVFVDVDSLDVLAIDVSTKVSSLVDD